MDKISDELKPILVFNGTWKVEGENLSGAPDSARKPISGTQKVKIMGSRFLEAHWDYQFDKGNEHRGISIIGKDNDSAISKMFLFDNGGSFRVYELRIDGNLWRIEGETERSTMEFGREGKTYKELWEIKLEGKWEPLCERNGTKTNKSV